MVKKILKLMLLKGTGEKLLVLVMYRKDMTLIFDNFFTKFPKGLCLLKLNQSQMFYDNKKKNKQ